VCYSLWSNAPTMLPAGILDLDAEFLRFQAIGRLHRGCITPQAVKHSLALLKMGVIIAQNMLSRLEFLINHYCCILLVFISFMISRSLFSSSLYVLQAHPLHDDFIILVAGTEALLLLIPRMRSGWCIKI